MSKSVRRPAKDRIMAKLDDIRGLVERHCGDTRQAVKEAVAESLVALSPALAQQQPMMAAPMGETGTCPGGAQGWNEFQRKFKEENKEYLKSIPYYEVKKKISDAWKIYKVTHCAKKTRTRKVKQPLMVVPQQSPMLVSGNQNLPQMIIPTTEPSVMITGNQPLMNMNQPLMNQPLINQNVKPRGKTLKIKNLKKSIQQIQNNGLQRNTELYLIGEDHPEFQQYTEPLRNRLAEQQEELNSIYKNYKSQKGQPNNNNMKRKTFKNRVASIQYNRNQVNQNMIALKGRVYEKTMKKRNNTVLAKKHVRILAPNNAIPKTPGSPKNNQKSLNNQPLVQTAPTYKSPNNNQMSPNNQQSLLQSSMNKSPNNQQVNYNYKASTKLFENFNNNNAAAIPQLISTGLTEGINKFAPQEKAEMSKLLNSNGNKLKLEVMGQTANMPNWYNAKINGKKYLYKENNTGKRLIEVLNNGGIGDFGYFNENKGFVPNTD